MKRHWKSALPCSVQGLRALRAALAVALGLGAVVLSGIVDEDGTASSDKGGAFSGREAVRRMGESDRGLDGLFPAPGAVPEWFSDEVFDVAGKTDLMANGDWSVVSWTEREDAPAVLEEVAASLRARGWAVVESGMEQVVTCVKEEGRCQWLWLSCTEVAGETSVVVQVTGAA